MPTSGEDIEELVGAGRTEAAEYALLIKIEHAEERSRRDGAAVASWPYLKLADLYRRQGREEAELRLLRRFAEQPETTGNEAQVLRERLEEMEEEVGR